MIETKVCTKCKNPKPTSDFGRHRIQADGLRGVCRACTAAYDATRKYDPQERRRRDLLKLYGLTTESHQALRASQNGCCKICTFPLQGGRKENVDHCHKTGTTRGILCFYCNTGIGKLKDSPELLRKAADYIESYKT